MIGNTLVDCAELTEGFPVMPTVLLTALSGQPLRSSTAFALVPPLHCRRLICLHWIHCVRRSQFIGLVLFEGP